MTEKREKEKTLSTWQGISASLIGMVIALIAILGFHWLILTAGEQAGLLLFVSIPLSIPVFFAGMFGGWLGAFIGSWMVFRFIKLKVPKWLVVILCAILGGILGTILPVLIWVASGFPAF